MLVLPCRAWTCENCAEQRKHNLIFDAAQGRPNVMLTLTVNPATGESPNHRAAMLLDAFTKMRRLINKQLQLPPEKRWRLLKAARDPQKQNQLDYRANRGPYKDRRRIEWLGFLERTKLGEPHAHILLRAPYIPQDWISEEMARLIGAPVVWIEKIQNTEKAIKYATKYVGKAPAKFGSMKRYWKSRLWLSQPREKLTLTWKRGDYIVRRESWRDVLQQRVVDGWSWYRSADSIWHFLKPEYANWSAGRAKTGEARGPPAAIAAA